MKLALLLLGLSVCVVAGDLGLRAREGAWDKLSALRHLGDINNAFHQGSAVNADARQVATTAGHNGPPRWRDFAKAYVQRYDKVVQAAGNGDRYSLDYGPLRLLTVSLWVRHLDQEFIGIERWDERYEITRPLLRFNTVCAAVAAIGMFLLVRHWVLRGVLPPEQRASVRAWRWARRSSAQERRPSLDKSQRPVVRAWAAGMVAAILLWLNPALILNSHAWPQWDSWIIPFYIWSVYLASNRLWLLAGALIGVGAMLKGQVMLVAPLLLLWPIFDLRIGALARVLTGIGVGVILVTWPWLFPTQVQGAVVWESPSRPTVAALICAIIAIGLMAPWFWLHDRRRWAWILPCAAVASALLIWPAIAQREWNVLPLLGLVALLVSVGPTVLHRRHIGVWATASIVCMVFACAVLFDASWSWLRIGFGYGTYQYQNMTMGTVTNMAAVLQANYRWSLNDPTFALPWSQAPLTLRQLLATIYFILLGVCALGAAGHWRRNDTRFLAAVITPWLLAFVILAQMHERYLVWGAVLSAAAVGVSWVFVLPHLAITFMSFMCQADDRLPKDGSMWHTMQKFYDGAHPSLAWGLLVLSLVYLYHALAPTPPGKLPIAGAMT